MPEKDKPYSEVRVNARPSRALLKAQRENKKRPADPLLAGYYFPQVNKQLQQYKLKQYGSKYEILPDEGTAAEIQEIQNNLQIKDFKFIPTIFRFEVL